MSGGVWVGGESVVELVQAIRRCRGSLLGIVGEFGVSWNVRLGTRGGATNR